MSEAIFRPGDRVRWFELACRPTGIVRAVYPTYHVSLELDDGTRHRVSCSQIQRINNRPGGLVAHCDACALRLDVIGEHDLQVCSTTGGRHRWRAGSASSSPKKRAAPAA